MPQLFKKVVIALLFLMIAIRLIHWRTRQQSAQRRCSEFDASSSNRAQLKGKLVKENEGAILHGLEVERVAFPGKLLLRNLHFPTDVLDGVTLVVSGQLSCRPLLRNPSRVADGFSAWLSPTLGLRRARIESVLPPEGMAWRIRWREAWKRWLRQPFQKYPLLEGFIVAVWLGDLSQLPPWLVRQYQEAGLIQLLALSGQHVACLSVLVLFLMRLVGAPIFFLAPFCVRKHHMTLRKTVPLIAAMWLWFTAVENPPIFRALIMVVAMTLLKWRLLHCNALQLLTSCAAGLLIWDPALISSAGFFLSTAATGFLAVLVFNVDKNPIGKYFFFSLMMPVLFFPLSAFFFAKVAGASPFTTVLAGWFWELILLPLGFMAPLMAHGLPESFSVSFVSALSKGWDAVLHEHMNWGSFSEVYFLTLRPTWWELLWIEIFLLWGVLTLKNRLFSRWL